MTRTRAAYTLLAPALLVAVWHHTVITCGAAYLLTLPRAGALALHAVGLVLGIVLALWQPRLRAAELSISHALIAGAIVSLAPLAYARASSFAVFVPVAAFAFGTATGAAMTSRLHFGRSADVARAILRALSPGPITFALVLLAAFVVVSHRAGLVRTGLALCAVAAVTEHLGLNAARARGAPLRPRASMAAALAALALGATLALVELIVPWGDAGRLSDPVVLSNRAPTSRIAMTAGRGAVQLYVDTSLRMSTIDAHRVREALAQPPLAVAPEASHGLHALVVGGGDGGALRELVASPIVASVTVVEPDRALVDLARAQPVLAAANAHAFDSLKARVVFDDPLLWLERATERFDIILVDSGEPDTPARAKLFTAYFFGLLRDHLARHGAGSMPTASPLAAREAHWCIVRTLEAAGLVVRPYAGAIPTMGDVGYALFGHDANALELRAPPSMTAHYLDASTLGPLFRTPVDAAPVDVEVNRLSRQVLLRYREEAAGR